jgi:hypothetical protein
MIEEKNKKIYRLNWKIIYDKLGLKYKTENK